ncbi:MAG TPA: 30S ribosomal protein S20 [Planctomycetota bacterium]
MPNNQSAKSALRKSLVNRERNRGRKSAMRTSIKRTLAAIEAKDLETAQASLVTAYKLIDKNAKWNQLHANTAARRKSKLAAAVNALKKEAATS